MLRSARQLSLDEQAFHSCPQDRSTIAALLAAATRKRADALLEANSLDTRVEANYDACFNIALAVLNAHGWKARPVPSHHRYTLEAACEAIGASEALFDRVDAIRDVRNLKYTGISRTRKDYEFSLKVLDEFAQAAGAWFSLHHGGLLKN
jgi:hypothetical protein